MKNKLPKHITLMVEKNNYVMAIKTLAEEKNISLDESKLLIDEFEETLKIKQQNNVASIAAKQAKKSNSKHNSQFDKSPVHANQSTNDLEQINQGLDKHLDSIGYKKPLIPYWMKRILVILIIITLLSLLFLQLMP